MFEEEFWELSNGNMRVLMDAIRVGDKSILPYMQHALLFLSGWFAKARVHPYSCVKFVLWLREMVEDKEALETRLSAVVYGYKRMGVDIDRFCSEIKVLFGINLCGLENRIREEEIKMSGMQEVLEHTTAGVFAYIEMFRINRILGVPSPYNKDVMFVPLGYLPEEYYAIADPTNHVVARGKSEIKIEEDKADIYYLERVAIGYPAHVEVYVNSLGAITKYKVVWETHEIPRILEIGPTSIKGIIERLDENALILNHGLARDVISAIIRGCIQSRATIKRED